MLFSISAVIFNVAMQSFFFLFFFLRLPVIESESVILAKRCTVDTSLCEYEQLR